MNVYVAYLATDGGRDAAALGAVLARTLGSEVALGMIVPPDVSAPLTAGDFDEILTAQADEWLAEARDLIPDDVSVTTHIGIYDSPAEGIIAEAERVGASLIVVGGSGGGILAPYRLGSVVNDLIHSAPMPVTLAPRGLRDRDLHTIREITCAFGDRPGSDEMLDIAIRGSERAGIPLRLISLVAQDLMPSGRRDDPTAIEAARKHAESILAQAHSRLPSTIAVHSTVATGTNVEEAAEQIDWKAGDVIIVGSSRLAAPRRLFLGSTAAKMLRVLDVPMVIVPKEMS